MIKTIICAQTGWYGSFKLWVHAPTAFNNWLHCLPNSKRDDWIFLGCVPEGVAKQVGTTDLPKHLNEFDEFVSFGVFADKEN
jgi:hypothetical protein